MGGCACKQDFRFKRLVVGVYPEDPEGDVRRDGIAKLTAYVAHNPERIPRVCRKVRKLVDDDVARGRMKRALVGVQTLRALLAATSSELDYYVPPVVDLSDTLLNRGEPEYHVAAADLMTALTYQLTEHLSYDDSSRRLLVDLCGPVIEQLTELVTEGLNTMRIDALHCRYAAIVALGSIASAVNAAVAPRVETLLLAVMHATQQALSDEESRVGAFADESMVRRSTRERYVSERLDELLDAADAAMRVPLHNVSLPVTPVAKDTAYRAACVRAVAAIVPCTTTAALPSLLESLFSDLGSRSGWATPSYALLVSHVLAISLQEHHQAGFFVCQHLVDRCLAAAPTHADEAACVLACVRRTIEDVPMTGTRPLTVFPTAFRFVASTVGSAAVNKQAASLVETIVFRSFTQRNTAAVVRTLSAMVRHASSMIDDAQRHTHAVDRLRGGLGVLSQLSCIAGALHGADRTEVGMAPGLIKVLKSSVATSEVRALALTCLARYVSRWHDDLPAATFNGLPDVAITQQEFDLVAEWLLTAPAKLREHAASNSDPSAATSLLPAECIGLGDVYCAVLQVRHAECLPWFLDAVFYIDELAASAAQPTPADAALRTMAAAMLRCAAIIFDVPQLRRYVEDVHKRNIAAGFRAPELDTKIHRPTPARCGVAIAVGAEESPLSGHGLSSTGTAFTRSTVVHYIIGAKIEAVMSEIGHDETRATGVLMGTMSPIDRSQVLGSSGSREGTPTREAAAIPGFRTALRRQPSSVVFVADDLCGLEPEQQEGVDREALCNLFDELFRRSLTDPHAQITANIVRGLLDGVEPSDAESVLAVGAPRL